MSACSLVMLILMQQKCTKRISASTPTMTFGIAKIYLSLRYYALDSPANPSVNQDLRKDLMT